MSRIRWASLVAAALLAACDGPPRDASVAAAVEVPLVPYIGRLVTVDATIQGEPVRLLFDTGGGETLISPAIAEKIGCTPSGRGAGLRATGERIDYQYCPDVTIGIGGLPFDHPQVAVWDVQAVLPEGEPTVDGVLSLETFARQPITLDLERQRLTLETAGSLRQRTGSMNELQARFATGSDGGELTVFVRATAPAAGWFLIDSANLDVVRVADRFRIPQARVDGTWEAQLKLEGIPGMTTTFRAADIIYDGMLSEEVIRQWTLTFDFAGQRVWASARTPDLQTARD